MSKAILVMDMPDSCLGCRFCREIDEGIEACCDIMDEPRIDCTTRTTWRSCFDGRMCKVTGIYCGEDILWNDRLEKNQCSYRYWSYL